MSGPPVRSVAQLLGPSSGGIRNHVATLASGLRERGIDAPVLGPVDVMDGLDTPNAVAVDTAVRVPRGLDPIGLLRARRDLAPCRSSIQILHAHGLKAGWVAVGGRPRVPLVITVHNMVLDTTAGRSAAVQRALERQVLSRADGVIAINETMAAALRDFCDPDRVRVAVPASPIPRPGIGRAEMRSSLGVTEATPLVVCVARLHPQKDLQTLLEAWAQVHSRVPGAVLVLVGDGPERTALEEMHRRLALGTSARLVGPRPDAVDVLAAADLAVMTSVWEGNSIVLAEALQLGVPMVSTPVGVAPELLDGRSGGVLVTRHDPSAVADALCSMLDDPGATAEIGLRGRAHARELFDPDRAIESIVDIYREVAR